jgi:hypothetical protein
VPGAQKKAAYWPPGGHKGSDPGGNPVPLWGRRRPGRGELGYPRHESRQWSWFRRQPAPLHAGLPVQSVYTCASQSLKATVASGTWPVDNERPAYVCMVYSSKKASPRPVRGGRGCPPTEQDMRHPKASRCETRIILSDPSLILSPSETGVITPVSYLAALADNIGQTLTQMSVGSTQTGAGSVDSRPATCCKLGVAAQDPKPHSVHGRCTPGDTLLNWD